MGGTDVQAVQTMREASTVTKIWSIFDKIPVTMWQNGPLTPSNQQFKTKGCLQSICSVLVFPLDN